MKRNLFLLAMAPLVFQSPGYAQDTRPPAPVWMSVTHEVVDLEAWRKVFDSALVARQGAGEIRHQITSFTANPHTIVAVFQWESAARARAFVNDPLVRDAMRRAGVTSEPVVALYPNPLANPARVTPAR